MRDHRDDDENGDLHDAARPVLVHDSTPAFPSVEIRKNEVGITDSLDLATAWPEVQRALLDFLRARRVDRATAEDVCQEVAVRALRRRPFGSVVELARWSERVAFHRVVDDWRRRGRHIADEPLPDWESPDDLATIVANRLAVAEVAAALPLMSLEERVALASGLDPFAREGDRATKNRLGVRRFRARERLRKMVPNFSIVFGCNRWLRRVQPALGDFGNVAVGLGLSVAILVAPMVGEPPRPSPDTAVVTLRSATGNRGPVHGDPAQATTAPSVASPREAAASRRDLSAANPAQPGRTSVAKVDDPVGSTDVLVYDNPPDQPLLCVVTAHTGEVCQAKPPLPLGDAPVPSPS